VVRLGYLFEEREYLRNKVILRLKKIGYTYLKAREKDARVLSETIARAERRTSDCQVSSGRQ